MKLAAEKLLLADEALAMEAAKAGGRCLGRLRVEALDPPKEIIRITNSAM